MGTHFHWGITEILVIITSLQLWDPFLLVYISPGAEGQQICIKLSGDTTSVSAVNLMTPKLLFCSWRVLIIALSSLSPAGPRSWQDDSLTLGINLPLAKDLNVVPSALYWLSLAAEHCGLTADTSLPTPYSFLLRKQPAFWLLSGEWHWCKCHTLPCALRTPLIPQDSLHPAHTYLSLSPPQRLAAAWSMDPMQSLVPGLVLPGHKSILPGAVQALTHCDG